MTAGRENSTAIYFSAATPWPPNIVNPDHLVKFRTLHVTLFVPLAALLFSCAHMGTPGGGPEDLTPPLVRAVFPQPGQVQVDKNPVIRFEFSEWIEPQTVKSNVSLFPPPPGGFKTRVTGRTLEIASKRLADSTTYHLELGADLQDLRHNSLGTPYHLVFSTGEQLDSGQIQGCVIDPAHRVLQPKVALFAQQGESTNDTTWLTLPDYVSQTDSGGLFRLANVREGTYRVCAFLDKNNDNRFQPLREQMYAPTVPVVQVGRTSERLHLFAVNCDTATFAVATVRPSNGTVIMVTWNRFPHSSADSAVAGSIHIESLDSAVAPPKVDTVVMLNGANRCALLLADTLTLTGYRLLCTRVPVFAPDSSFVPMDTVRFNGVVTTDTIPPRVVRTTPSGQSGLEPTLILTFNEPVRFLDTFSMLADTSGDSIEVTCLTRNWTDSLVFKPTSPLSPATTYRHLLRRKAVQDLAGLSPTDTTDTTGFLIQTLRTLSAEDICDGLAGDSSCFVVVAAQRWVFNPIGAGQPVQCLQTAGGGFAFKNIPAGKGTLSRFVDRNGDGLATAGNLIPWYPPEENVPYYDTLDARARWDLTNIPVPVCDPCNRGQQIASDPSVSTRKKPTAPTRSPAPRTLVPIPGL